MQTVTEYRGPVEGFVVIAYRLFDWQEWIKVKEDE